MHPLAGRKQDPEHVAKRVAALRAAGVYARFTERAIARNKARIGSKLSEETKRKMSIAHKGMQNALGFKRDAAFKRKLSDYWAAHQKEHNHYVDGRSLEYRHERKQAMARLDYREWRTAVFTRDDYTCVICHQRGGRLQADHIKPWKTHPELRYDVANGRTLCISCHRRTPTWGNVN